VALHNTPDTAGTDEQTNFLGASQPQVKSYLASLADAFGLPRELVHAVAQTESGMDTNKIRSATASSSDALGLPAKSYGAMQVSDENIGKTAAAPDGTPFQIDEDMKTDWKANARAGVALLARHYQLAELEQPLATMETRAQQAYSGYTSGNSMRDRYMVTLPDDLPAHPADRAFLRNLRNGSYSPDVQAMSASESQDSQQASSQSGRAQQMPSQANTDAPNRISAAAQKYSDAASTAWALDAKKDEFQPGQNKCNKFVGDVITEAGARATVLGEDGKPLPIAPGSKIARPPRAADWADSTVSIPNWRVLWPAERPQPGDVAAYKLPGGGRDFSGHSGIITSIDPSGTVHGVAAHDDKIGPDDKFQPPTSNSDRKVVYRRYTGP
jgi:hypothetical protein